jgi:hypothetical protein
MSEHETIKATAPTLLVIGRIVDLRAALLPHLIAP